MNETAFLNADEKELIVSLEKDGWEPTDNPEGWKTRLSKAAANTLAKDHRMGIRITRNGFDGIKNPQG